MAQAHQLNIKYESPLEISFWFWNFLLIDVLYVARAIMSWEEIVFDKMTSSMLLLVVQVSIY